jgi:hypothetical protein
MCIDDLEDFLKTEEGKKHIEYVSNTYNDKEQKNIDQNVVNVREEKI